MFSIFSRSGDWKTFFKNAPVTSFIIIINTIFLFVTIILCLVNGQSIGSILFQGFDIYTLLELGAIWPPVMLRVASYWRIITAAFLHGSMIHYLSNMIIGVLTLSSGLERLIGSKKFSIIYFGSMIFSGLFVLLMSDVTTVTIGASGAIFGVLGSLLWITLYRRDMITPRDAQGIRSLIFVNIIFTFMFPGISIWGHAAGLVGGLLLSFVVIKRNIFKVLH